MDETGTSSTEAKAYEGKISELWIYKTLRYNLFVLMICWMACSFGFYMLSYVLKYLHGSIFVNAYASAIAEIVGKLSSIILLRFMSLKRVLLIAYGTAAIGTVLLITFSTSAAWIPLMLLIAKFGFSQAFVAAYLGVILLYPTILTSTAMGVCNLLARVASITAPLVAEVRSPLNLTILLVIAGFALLSSQCLTIPAQKAS